MLETSMSSTEPIAEGSDDSQVTSLITQVGNASVMTHLRKEKWQEALSLLQRGGEVATESHPGGDHRGPSWWGLPGATWPGPSQGQDCLFGAGEDHAARAVRCWQETTWPAMKTWQTMPRGGTQMRSTSQLQLTDTNFLPSQRKRKSEDTHW